MGGGNHQTETCIKCWNNLVINREKDWIHVLSSKCQMKEKTAQGRKSRIRCFKTLGAKPPSFLKIARSTKAAPSLLLRGSSQDLTIEREPNLCVLGRIIYLGFCFVWVFKEAAPAVHLGIEQGFNGWRVCFAPLEAPLPHPHPWQEWSN